MALVVALLLRSFIAGALTQALGPFNIYNPFSFGIAQFTYRAQMVSENEALKAALASTTAHVLDRDLLYQENIDLKARFGRDANQKTILAGILLRPPGVPYDTLVIDAGKQQGLQVGNYVSGGGTTIIGEIDQVYTGTSRVVLFSAPGQSHQALLSENSTHGVVPMSLEGQGAGSLVGEVPAHTQVSIGDPIIFSGLSDELFGLVTAVDAKAGESFERVYLHLPVNPLELRFVEVLVN